MAKHRKTATKSARGEPAASEATPAAAPAAMVAHPPVRRPTLLAVSLVLFALWFTFLLVTALSG